MRTTLLCITLFVAVASSATAHAQEPDAAATAEARRIARRATRDYNAGRYPQALEGYERAYALVPAPGLLFNLGQCLREIGRHGEAVEHFERYLRERPDAPNAELVRELMRESRAAMQTGAALEQEASRERERERAAVAELDRARAELEAARQAGAEQIEAQRERYEAALAELEQARAALEQTRVRMLRRAEEEEAARARVAATPTQIHEEWWFWTLIAGLVLATGAGITIGVVVGQSPVLPSGTLGTIDAR